MKRMVTLAIAIVVLITVTSVWAYRRHRVDPQVQQIVQAQEKAFDDQLTDEQRTAMFNQFRGQMRNLSDSQRREAFGQMRPLFQRRANERMAAYCQMTKDQRMAYLNQQIAELQRRQEEREARQAAEAQGASNAQDGSSSQNGNAQNGNGGRGGPGGVGNRFNQDARNQRRDQRLNNSTPEQRAQRTVFVQEFRQQCQAQGVTPPRYGGGGRF